MATQTFTLRYTFVSTKSDGDDYTRTLRVKARDRRDAEQQARIAGFRAFGQRFNDNCIDWRIDG